MGFSKYMKSSSSTADKPAPEKEGDNGEQKYEVGNPYHIGRRGNRWVVVKNDDGKVMGRFPSHAKALAQFRALEIAAHKEDPGATQPKRSQA